MTHTRCEKTPAGHTSGPRELYKKQGPQHSSCLLLLFLGMAAVWGAMLCCSHVNTHMPHLKQRNLAAAIITSAEAPGTLLCCVADNGRPHLQPGW
jgi:hypothetical protein